MKIKCSLETAVVMVVSLSLVSQAAQPGIHRAAGQKTQLGKAPVSPCGLERRLLLTSGDGGHLDCTQMEGFVSDVGSSDAGDLLVSVPRMNVERTSSPPLPATSSPSLHLFWWELGRLDLVLGEAALCGDDRSLPSDAASWLRHTLTLPCD